MSGLIDLGAGLVTGRCEACGQLCLADQAWTVRGRGECCRGPEPVAAVGEPERLFEPPPEQLPGQLAMDGAE